MAAWCTVGAPLLLKALGRGCEGWWGASAAWSVAATAAAAAAWLQEVRINGEEAASLARPSRAAAGLLLNIGLAACRAGLQGAQGYAGIDPAGGLAAGFAGNEREGATARRGTVPEQWQAIGTGERSCRDSLGAALLPLPRPLRRQARMALVRLCCCL